MFMAKNTCNVCPVGIMDRLWFHQIILLSQPNIISSIPPQMSAEEEPATWFDSQPPSLSNSSIEVDEDIETDFSPPESPPKSPKKKRRNRSHASLLSPIDRDLLGLSRSAKPRLEKSMSCRSLGELELEEVKGFLDLGFTFKKEHMSPRMMSLIPGLQRLDSLGKSRLGQKAGEEEVEDSEGERCHVSRPYLSEAWLIRKPSSPLLNLKIPRFSGASDMKKHLKFWARTVACEVQQVS